MKKILVFCFWLLAAGFWPNPAFAAEKNFTVANNVTYAVAESGLTHITFAITLTNSTTKYFAPNYTMHIGVGEIANAKGTDDSGQLPTIVKKTADGNSVTVEFSKKIVGKGEKRNFTISFDTLGIAQKHGDVWEINVPGLSNINDFSSFNAHVQIPSSFGTPTFIKPKVAKNTKTGMYDFSKNVLKTSGISLAFGTSQTYSFKLVYHLKNSHLFPVRTEIAFPPSTNYQDVFIDSIDDKPLNVIEDKDGNWLAQYHLLPSEKKDVTVTGKVQINLFPKKDILSAESQRLFLEETKFWQINSSEIKNLANILKTPEAIYVYVIKTLRYDFSRVTGEKSRVGALGVLKNPGSAVCLEFTDLFIALARAAGIPAREVDGYAYTENEKQRPLSLEKDILHAWAEYYDYKKQTWIMVDPTWGNTTGGVDYFHTFDFDHIAFVVKGKDSTYPIPAGGYKFAGIKKGHDIEVGFAENVTEHIQNVKVQSKLHEWYIAGLPFSAEIMLQNVGNSVIFTQPVKVDTQTLSPQTQTVTFTHIPPYGSVTLPVSFNRTSFLTNKKETITIQVAGKSLSDTISIIPFYFTKWMVGGGVLLGVCSLGVFIFTRRSGRVSVSHK